jgi:nucleotide-binding universal stress UspA family protein
VNCFVESGQAAETIVDRGSKDPLIAMATHGRSAAKHWLLGNIAQKVLQASTNPLLLVRPNQDVARESNVRLSILILPLDGSHLAEKTFPHAVYIANCLKLEVALIRAYNLPTTGYFMASGITGPAIQEIKDRIKQEITEYLQSKAEQLRGEGIQNVSFVAMEGAGPEEIIELAQKTPGSLAVMSSHGRTGMGRWVLGSVTDRVVSYAGGPVLVIRPASA